MKNKIFLKIVLITIFLIIFLVFYQGLKNSNIYTPNTNIKKDIPLLNVKIFGTNEVIKLKKIFEDDKFYLMNIWASWCVPCRDEHPFLMKIKNNKNIKIIGLNYKDNYKNAKNFLNELDNPYNLILSDNDGTIAIEWGAYGVPETYLIHKKKIIKKIIGPLNEESLLEIKRLFDEVY